MDFSKVSPIDFLIAAFGFAIPIVLAIGANSVFKVIAKRAQAATGEPLRETLAWQLRLPTFLGSLVLGFYICSLSVRTWDVDALRLRNWPLFEKWLIAIAILIGFYLAYRLAVVGLRFLARRAGRDPSDYLFMRKLAAAMFAAIGLITALNLLGVNIGPVLASLGVAGIAVALALQDTLGNYFASLSLTMDRTLKIGDYVRLDSGQEGFVEEIGWRTTRIRPYGETMIVVPNSKLTSSIVTNFYLPENSVRVYIDFGVGYQENLEEVEEVLIATAKEVVMVVPGADTQFEPIVRFKEFADSNITGTVTLRAVDFEMSFRLKHEYIKAVHRKFAEAGIAINYPVRQILPMPVDVPMKYPAPSEPRDVI